MVAAWPRPSRAAAQGLDRFTTPGVACKTETPTPAVRDDRSFRAGAPARTNLRAAGIAGTALTVSGVVKGLVCGPIKGARIDFWQPDDKGVYDSSGFRLRGYQLTDENGRYHLETMVPADRAGVVQRLNARVQAPNRAPLTTAVFLPNRKSNATDPLFNPDLQMTVTSAPGEAIVATFDFVLDA